MKLGRIAVFLLRDTEGFASAISEALNPNPSSSFSRVEDSFHLSLDDYGIKDLKASGNLLHYVDNQGVYKVSLVIMQHYEPPVLACALNEVLKNITGDDSSLMPTLLVPFLVESSKVKGQSKSLRSDESKASIFGIQIGRNTDIMQALLKRTQEPPSSLQIQHETFACFLHFVRVMQLPAFFLIGQTSHEENDITTSHSLRFNGLRCCATHSWWSYFKGRARLILALPDAFFGCIFDIMDFYFSFKNTGTVAESVNRILLHLSPLLLIDSAALMAPTVKAIHEISEILASSTGLLFSKDRVIWNPKKTVKESKEPWRDLYG